MPPLPRLRIAALDELSRQLRFAPPETLRRQLDRTRKLAAEIDPARNYPEEWVIFRVTGYRPQNAGETVFVGEALLGDISALVERLSAAAGLRHAELKGGDYLELAALEKRWSVSRKTLERYRRRGLVAQRDLGKDDRPRLVFPVDDVARFELRHGERLREARAYTRMGPEAERRILREARVFRRRQGCTLNQAAARIAERHGRALETVRQVLKRHDRESGEPIFGGHGPATPRERELIERASFWSIEPGAVAERLSRQRPAVLRVISDQRAVRLRTLTIPPQDEPAPDESILKVPGAREGLGAPGETDMLALVTAARSAPPPPATMERARAAAYRLLLRRAAGGIAVLPAHGCGPTAVDRIETDLRWAARLKAELIRSQLPLVVRTLESTLKKAPEEMRTGELGAALAACIEALAGAVDEFQTGKGGRLAAPAGLALTRVTSRLGRDPRLLDGGRPRAIARLTSGVPITDWTRSIAPWQSYRGRIWLEPLAQVRAGLPGLREGHARILTLRYGWAGPAHTLEEAAGLLGTTRMKAAMMERRAVREAIRGPTRRPRRRAKS